MGAGQVVKKSLYRDFFTTEQGESLYVCKTSETGGLIDDLGFAWRSAAYAAAMPGQLSGQIPSFIDGWASGPRLAESQKTTMERVLGALVLRLPSVTADPAFLAELRTTILELMAELAAVREQDPLVITEEELWNEFLEKPEFQFYIISSQRFCYITTYAAYESFLVGLVRQRIGDMSVRVTDRSPSFVKRLEEAVGVSMSSKCWSAEPVAIAREVRNALLHERGRVTKRLEPYREKLRIGDDEIQLHPADNRKLFKDLLERVLLLLAEFERDM